MTPKQMLQTLQRLVAKGELTDEEAGNMFAIWLSGNLENLSPADRIIAERYLSTGRTTTES